jgi:hypothetical protein
MFCYTFIYTFWAYYIIFIGIMVVWRKSKPLHSGVEIFSFNYLKSSYSPSLIYTRWHVVRWSEPVHIYIYIYYKVLFFFRAIHKHIHTHRLIFTQTNIGGLVNKSPKAIISVGLCTPDNEKYTRPAATTKKIK